MNMSMSDEIGRMHGSRQDRYVHWALGAIAGISVGISILDVIGIAPGWASRLTPFFVGVLLLYVVLERERVDSIKYIVRRLDKGIDKLRAEVRPTGKVARAQKRRGSAGTNGAEDAETSKRSIPWKGMIFRSNTEVRVARALDEAGLFFLSPSTARVTTMRVANHNGNQGNGRETREIDFLIFHDGRWGVLEVDGPYHHAQNDALRDKLLRAHGLTFIARFDAERCYHEPRAVVKDFLQQFAQAGQPQGETVTN